MVEGQRFYLAFAAPTPATILPASWAMLFEPLTDVIVAIDGIFVGVDRRVSPICTFTSPDPEKTFLYIASVLTRAVDSKRKADPGPAATVQFVVLRRTGVGAAAYVVVDAPIAGFPETNPDCCGNFNVGALKRSFCLVAYAPDTWANLGTYVALEGSPLAGGSLADGDVLLAINGHPVDGHLEQAQALLAEAAAEGAQAPYALVKRGPLRPESKPKFDAGSRGWVEAPFSESCGGGEVYKMAPTGWWSVAVVPLPPEACRPGGLALKTGEYSIGGWKKHGYAVGELQGKFGASSGYWMMECMRGEWAALSLEEDPSRDELSFTGCKVYSDLWFVGGHNAGIIIPCLCFPFPICYRYTRAHGGNRFDPKCGVLPCYGPWIVTFHGCCCTESGTFTDPDTFESACKCCGKMTRRR